MKIYDMHIHGKNTPQDPKALIAAWEKAGIYGGCVFSAPPKEQEIYSGYLGGGSSYEDRIAELRGWTEGYEDRIFPVMWIHPHEENIIEKVRAAVKEDPAWESGRELFTAAKAGDERALSVIDAWMEEMNVEYFYENFGITGA